MCFHFFCRFLWLDTVCLKYSACWKESTSHKQEFLSKEAYEALRVSTLSTVLCIKHLLQLKLHFVLNRKFSSDDVESLFPAIRQLNGSNELTDAYAALSVLKRSWPQASFLMREWKCWRCDCPVECQLCPLNLSRKLLLLARASRSSHSLPPATLEHHSRMCTKSLHNWNGNIRLSVQLWIEKKTAQENNGTPWYYNFFGLNCSAGRCAPPTSLSCSLGQAH